MALERNTVFPDLAEPRKGKHLESTGIGKDIPVPVRELVQSAIILENICSRSQIEMIGISQYYLIANLSNFIMIDAFDCPVCTDGHESWCLHITMRKRKYTKTSLCILIFLKYLNNAHIFLPKREITRESNIVRTNGASTVIAGATAP